MVKLHVDVYLNQRSSNKLKKKKKKKRKKKNGIRKISIWLSVIAYW